MSNVTKSYNSISLADAASLVSAVGGRVTCLFSGEMGIGKSSMLNTLREQHPDHHTIYLEAQTLDVGDIQMPKFKNVDGHDVVAFVPNEALGIHSTKPVILMIDELGKASKAVMNALLRIMLERKLGALSLPEGSMVFATTNLGVEGLGDNIPAHARNRLCQMRIRKPTAMEWIEEYAIKAGIHPVVIGAALEFPAMFESFEAVEDPNSNHYIFHPKQPRTAFVTPRSLEKASDILKATDALSDDVRIHALMGVVGEAAAMDILTLVKLDDALPRWEQVVIDPENAKLPKGGAASCMLIAKACQRIDKDTFDKWMTYAERMSKEAQALFARTVMRGDKRNLACTNKRFTVWATSNMYMFS